MTFDLIADLVRILAMLLFAKWYATQALHGYRRLLAGADEDALNITAWAAMSFGIFFAAVAIFIAWGIAAGEM